MLCLILFSKRIPDVEHSSPELPVELVNLLKLKRRQFLADAVNDALLDRAGFDVDECKIASVLMELHATQEKILKKSDEDAVSGGSSHRHSYSDRRVHRTSSSPFTGSVASRIPTIYGISTS